MCVEVNYDAIPNALAGRHPPTSAREHTLQRHLLERRPGRQFVQSNHCEPHFHRPTLLLGLAFQILPKSRQTPRK